MNFFKAMKWSNLISGILLVLLGAVMLFTPGQNLVWLGLIISIAVLIAGIAALINYFTVDKADRSGWMLAEAIITTLIGVWMVFGSGSWAVAALIPYVFAVFILASGIVRIAESLELRSAGSRRWGWLLAFGIVSIILGVLLLLAPMISASFVSIALALLVIGYGISNITLFVNMQRAGNYIRDKIRERME